MNAETIGGELRMLLAVVAVAAGPVVGAVIGAHASVRPAKPGPPIILVQPVVVEMAVPRTLPSGAPACGNVVTRAIPQVTP